MSGFARFMLVALRFGFFVFVGVWLAWIVHLFQRYRSAPCPCCEVVEKCLTHAAVVGDGNTLCGLKHAPFVQRQLFVDKITCPRCQLLHSTGVSNGIIRSYPLESNWQHQWFTLTVISKRTAKRIRSIVE